MSDSAKLSLVVLIAAHTCARAADTADRGIDQGSKAWATVSLRRDGMLVQVERDGHPSMNPIVIADDQQDEFNAGQPADDVENYLKPLSELLEGHGYPHDEATAAALTLLPTSSLRPHPASRLSQRPCRDR